MTRELWPTIFVRYANGGIVAFETAEEARANIPRDHLGIITGAWNQDGRVVILDPGSSWGVQLTPSDEPADPAALREVLTNAIKQWSATEIEKMSYEEFINHCYALMRLKTPEEMRVERWSGCYNGGCSLMPLYAVGAVSPVIRELFRRGRGGREGRLRRA